MSSPSPDYTLYLVTGRELLPPGKDYYESLNESLEGGVTIVQIREKNTDTREFLEIAKRSKEICHRYGVPLLINDRIDIALAMNADGIHIGQSDMPIEIARKLLPAGSIIGVSVNTPAEAEEVVKGGLADYVGIGALWATNSKKLTSPVLGIRGVGPILQTLEKTSIKAVAIGGIKSSNLLRSLHGAVSPNGRALDGIAVVSEIVSSHQPSVVAQRLCQIIRAFKDRPFSLFSRIYAEPPTAQVLVDSAAHLLCSVKEYRPLVHQITNNVTINQLANATLALGASPIMATSPHEMEDLAKIPGALLINFGTISDKEGMLAAGHYANLERKPIVFDPVGIGATAYRRTTANELLNTWQAAVIKGNAGEIASLIGSNEVKSHGVDSLGSGFSSPKEILCALAKRERCIIVMTGETDYVSDGNLTVKLSNGSAFLGDITGSGCLAGSTVATFCGAENKRSKRSEPSSGEVEGILAAGDMFVGAIAGVLTLTIASELAAQRPEVHGTGTFLSALIDELYNLTPEKIIQRAKLEVV
ncbi:TMP-TENI-domain-containing protein [Sistotremastrum niveocremeum HHB9708]|uniref:TMP-TENI-domain-containing protein n=1 Tax=Sistotremastrum niveocremeum HHB9708 TaxID=1314777 RepID=A0A165A343_9AGAM|nr:TMP-TENI-domain-containing protein [Sistotremastrum niveocremeum HHB9708]